MRQNGVTALPRVAGPLLILLLTGFIYIFNSPGIGMNESTLAYFLSLVIGLGSYLVWKYIVAGVLTLHLVNSYVYLGNHPFWIHVNAVARRMLTPATPGN